MPRKKRLGRIPKQGKTPKKAKLPAPPAPAPAPAPAPTPAPATKPPSLPPRATRSVAAEELEYTLDEGGDGIDDADNLFLDKDVPTLDLAVARRMTIAYIYVSVLKSPPQMVPDEDGVRKDQWLGNGGTIAEVLELLPGSDGEDITSQKQMIRRVLVNVNICYKSGIQYEGKINWGGGAQSLITLESPEAQIICDSIEQGNSIVMTKLILNNHRMDNDKNLYGYSAIYNCYKSMKPKVTHYKIKKQGSTDADSPWALASHRQFLQLLIRFNKIEDTDSLLDQFKEDGVLPPWLNRNNLSNINPNRVSYWDETHRKCKIGDRGSREAENVYVSFPKDEHGRLDVAKGKHESDDEQKRIVNVKYEKEVRLCLGVIKLYDEDSKEDVGHRLPAYSYTSKNVITFNDRDKYRKIEMQHICQSGSKIAWVKDMRVEGALYQNDKIRQVKGVGKFYNERLTALGITEVWQLKGLDEEEMKSLKDKDSRLQLNKLREFKQLAQVCLMEDVPAKKDHRKSENPYLSMFGIDNWEAECDKKALVGKVCVSEMIDHMFEETKKCFPDSEDWWVYHDALSLMTAKSSVEYMKKKNYYEHWVLPEQDYVHDLPQCKRFGSRPVGNRPEVMPLDQQLNKDVHDGVDRHVILTQHLDDDDVRKFSMKTPIQGLSAYLRIWDLHPPSKRIIHDIDETLSSMKIIVENKGIIVEGLATRPGDRFVRKGSHGGARTRMTQEQRRAEENKKFIHPDARFCLKHISDNAVSKTE